MTIKKRNITDIGQLNKRVSLQVKSTVGDGAGGIDPVWSEWLTVWASIDDSGGIIYGSVNAHTETIHNLKFIIRYNNLIYEKPISQMRLVYMERAYKLRNIRNLNQANRYLEIVCDGNEWESI